MKIYKTDEFVEKLNISQINLDGLNDIENNSFIKYNYFPKIKDELQSIIEQRISIEGPNLDLNDIDVSEITDMSGLFMNFTFDGDISQWNVSNVKNMSYMFCYSSFNGDISNWNVSNVTNMKEMFYESEFNGDISNWNVSNVITMYGMFYNSQFNQNISNWNVSNVKQYKYIFENCPLEKYLKKQPKFND